MNVSGSWFNVAVFRLTAVVTEGVEHCDQAVQTGPVVWVTA